MATQRHALISILALGLASVSLLLAPDVAHAGQSDAGQSDAGQSDAAAAPDQVALAESYAAQAFDAYRVHDYGHALLLYEQALAAAPSPDILYNIARIYDVGLRDRRLAIDYYERYTAERGAAPERRTLVRQRLLELRAAERASQTMNADDIDAIAREFPLDEPDAATAPARSPARRARGDGGLRPLELGAIALGAAGLTGVGLGIGFGLSARSGTEVWRHDCNGNECSSQRGVDAARAAARRASVATVSFAAGGSLLALGAMLWWIDAGPHGPDGSTALRFAPHWAGSGVGGSMSGRF